MNMKLFGAALAIAAAVGSANADVESANVVGYKTVSCTGGKWYMIAADFQTVGNTAAQKTLKISEFIKGDFIGSTVEDNCPIIQIWDASTSLYSDWRFYSESTGLKSKRKQNFWGLDNVLENWDGYQAATIDIGKAVWFRSPTDCTITVAGQVCEVKENNVDVSPNQWCMIANPWPIALNINSNINWTAQVEAGNMKGSTVEDDCPIIQVWDSATSLYADYRFYSESTGLKSKRKKDFWGLDNVLENWETNQNATVPVGYGFWFRYHGTTDKPMTLTFTR